MFHHFPAMSDYQSIPFLPMTDPHRIKTILDVMSSLEKNEKNKHAPDLPEKSCRPCSLCFSFGKLILGAKVDPKAISAPCIPTSYSKFQELGSLNSCWSVIAFNLDCNPPTTPFAGCLLTQLKGANSPFNFLKRVYSNQGLITQAKSGTFLLEFSSQWDSCWSGCTHQSFTLDFINAIDHITVQQILPHLQSHLVPSFILHTNFSTPKLQTP